MTIGFIIGGLGLMLGDGGPTWWAVWVGAGVAVLGLLVAIGTNMFALGSATVYANANNTSGTVATMASTRGMGTPSARPTSRIAARAASVPKVPI